ncbi:MAG: B12-binding domain-containing radical SAM protein [Saprospiraceae bacterium]|nr:B12-binding domain-containing radical SAM protein [Saprospiraceae bacterium]
MDHDLLKNKVILFNPRSANSKYRIPNSILQIGASIHGKYEYVFVDGNMEKDPWSVIANYLETGDFKYFGTTVMPGPQLNQAIPYASRAKKLRPDLINIWGGYFAANQYKTVCKAPYIDFAINGPGDKAFPALLDALEAGRPFELIPNLIYRNNDGEIILTSKDQLLNQDELPPLPYEYLDTFYPIKKYLGNTFLGSRTMAYHSSVGCPFKCSFCAVVPIYEARWKGKNATHIYNDVIQIKEKYGANAIEFHDNNFFVSESRVLEFSQLMSDQNMKWWGEGRIDTVDQYADSTLAQMRKSGCRMIFFGAESGNDLILKEMDKGGKQTAEQIKRFAARMKKFDIIPEYSFVLGMPADSPEKVMEQIDSDILFIKEIKKINPDTEIIIYIYSPVPTEGSALFQRITEAGFSFPQKLEDWLSPAWLQFDLRKNPLTPWLTKAMVNKIKNFETVLNARYPTKSDIKLSHFQRMFVSLLSTVRYKLGYYNFPYELKLLQKFWLRYRQPELEGF